MESESHLLGTPAGYATPEQLKEVRALYQNLLSGTGQQPVKHWTQGISNMVSALVGGLGNQKTIERENEARRFDQKPQNMPAWSGENYKEGNYPAAPKSADTGSSPTSAAAVRTNNPGAQWPGPVAAKFGSTESVPLPGGNKIAVFDDPVKGAAAQFALLEKSYTGIPLSAAVSKWSGGNNAGQYLSHIAKATGLTPDTVITPELLRGPKGIELAKAMAHWEAGKKYPLADQQWQAAHKLAFGGGQGGPALAFSGEPTNVPPALPGTPPPMATALAGQPMAAAARPNMQPPMPTPQGVQPGHVATNPETGQAVIPEGLTPQRTVVTRRQFENTMQSPYVSPEMKQFVAQSYYAQGQPLEMATAGGRVVINPQRPSQQMFIPDLQKGNLKAPGGAEVPWFGHVGPGNKFQMYGEGGATAPTAPKANPNIDVPDLNFAPNQEGKIPAAVLNGLPPEILTGQSAPKMPAGLPPVALPFAAEGGGEAPAIPAEGTKVAQIPDYANRMIDALSQKGVEYEANKKQAEKDIEAYQAKATVVNDVGLKAATSKPAITMAKTLVQDPNMVQGVLAQPRLDFKRFLTLISDNPNAKRSVEVSQAFDKLISGNILDDLKITLQGLGQVRVAEIDLLKQAAASRSNDLGSNMAILRQMDKAHDLAIDLSKISTAYGEGVRWDKNGKVIRSPTGAPVIHADRPTSSGLQSALRTYVEKHPILTKDEIAQYETQFKEDVPSPARPVEPPKARSRSGTPPKIVVPETTPPAPPGFGPPR